MAVQPRRRPFAVVALAAAPDYLAVVAAVAAAPLVNCID